MAAKRIKELDEEVKEAQNRKEINNETGTKVKVFKMNRSN